MVVVKRRLPTLSVISKTNQKEIFSIRSKVARRAYHTWFFFPLSSQARKKLRIWVLWETLALVSSPLSFRHSRCARPSSSNADCKQCARSNHRTPLPANQWWFKITLNFFWLAVTGPKNFAQHSLCHEIHLRLQCEAANLESESKEMYPIRKVTKNSHVKWNVKIVESRNLS